MALNRRSIPTWAVLNTVLLFAPIFVSIAAFGSYRFWFVPRSELIIPAAILLVVYYTLVLRICASNSGHSFRALWPTFRRSHPDMLSPFWLLLGVLIFGTSAFYAFYSVVPAAFTVVSGTESKEYVTVASIDTINHTARCGAHLEFLELSPAMSSGFCLGNRTAAVGFEVGDRITLHGQRSDLGFWVNRIEH